MRIAKIVLGEVEQRLALIEEGERGDRAIPLDLDQVDHVNTLTDVLQAPDPAGLAKYLVDQKLEPVPVDQVDVLAPIDKQEVWAAGVTYKRSQVARMEESESAADHYDKVYTADRPELFFKATPYRVVGPGRPIRVRADSEWSVPEPELALYVSPELKLCGFTVGNDVSARDIEGENPLYLPQAKVYKQSCALGPAVFVPEAAIEPADFRIVLSIARNAEEVFRGETDGGQLARTFEDLISWLGRENEFPTGAILLTGTGIVPPDDFTLKADDVVTIDISGIGSLTNPVVCGP